MSKRSDSWKALVNFRIHPFLLFGLALLIVLLAGCEGAGDKREAERAPPKTPSPPDRVEGLLTMERAFISVADEAVSSVVNISTTPRINDTDKLGKKPFLHDFFQDLFPVIPGRPETSLGSGVIISDKGYIVTNEHVIRDAGEITVRLQDTSEYKARVIGTDPKTDIAVLKISAKEKLIPARLGDSSVLQVGQWAIAVGNPFGLNSTVTVGVISAKGRTDVGVETYEDFIQTDASINPGNSGGPLLNISGEVIGINTAIISSGQGIGFAIPINLVRNITGQIIKTGNVRRGWLGVGIQELTDDLAASFGIKSRKGVLINNVFGGSPAEEAGIRRGDIVVSFNGIEVGSLREFQRMVATYPVGKEAKIELLRGREKKMLVVTVGEVPKETEVFSFKQPEADRLGLVVGNVPEAFRKSAGIPGGVRVEAVIPDAPAHAAGIREDDIIIDLNREKVSHVSDYKKIIESLNEGDVLSVLVHRKGRTIYLALKIL